MRGPTWQGPTWQTAHCFAGRRQEDKCDFLPEPEVAGIRRRRAPIVPIRRVACGHRAAARAHGAVRFDAHAA